MTARDWLHARLTGACIDTKTASEQLDAYRTEVLRKAADRLRSIPVQCTALTGPVWYGEGWKDAITQLEEIADYQKPDDAAYPGELEMLRGLLLNLRVAARKGDLDRVQQLLASHDVRAAEQQAPERTTA